MTGTELAWLAGVLEGEGCFYLTTRHNKDGTPRPLISIICCMTDEDVIRRIHMLVGSGNVHMRDRRPGGYKLAWTWQDSRVSTVVPLLTLLRPLMGARRGAKIDELLVAVDGWKWRFVRDHGHRAMYSKGCRCALCKRAHATYTRERRLRLRALTLPDTLDLRVYLEQARMERRLSSLVAHELISAADQLCIVLAAMVPRGGATITPVTHFSIPPNYSIPGFLPHLGRNVRPGMGDLGRSDPRDRSESATRTPKPPMRLVIVESPYAAPTCASTWP